MKLIYSHFFTMLFIFILGTGCAPTFNDFQRADTVGKSNLSITTYTSTTSSEDFDQQTSSDDEVMPIGLDEELQDVTGFKASYGISENIDFNMKYETISGGLVEGNVISLGLKTLIINKGNNRYAFNLLFSSADQSISDLTTSDNQENNIKYIEPTLLGSSKINNLFDFNYSFKILSQIDGNGCDGFFDCPDSETGYGANFSIAYDIPSLEFLTFIPEYGILELEPSTYTHIGYAIAFDYLKFKDMQKKK